MSASGVPQPSTAETGGPVLSVAIATRNYARFLPRALNSALQAGALLRLPFEIVVDDASTDERREIFERFRLAQPECARLGHGAW
jgi:glycosyltransferase involved in cell wall biosynthesis